MTQHGCKAKAIESDKVEKAFCGQWNALNKLLIDQRLLMPIEYIAAITNVLPIKDQSKCLSKSLSQLNHVENCNSTYKMCEGHSPQVPIVHALSLSLISSMLFFKLVLLIKSYN